MIAYQVRVIFLLMFGQSGILLATPPSEADIQQQINASGSVENYLKEFAASFNKELPAPLGKNEELVSVEADKKEFTFKVVYTKKVNLDFYLSNRDEIYQDWLAPYCEGISPLVNIWFSNDITIIHEFFQSKDGLIMDAFIADKSICEEFRIFKSEQ